MSINGTLKADQLVLGKFSVDWLRETMRVTALAALVNSKTGQTHAFIDGAGVQWSTDTKRALDELRVCMESDLARVHLEGASVVEQTLASGSAGLKVSGLGEHLGTTDGVPSI